MHATHGLWLMMTLLPGCRLAGSGGESTVASGDEPAVDSGLDPCAGLDCLAPGIYLIAFDADGQRLEPDHVTVYQDDVLVRDVDCATEDCWIAVAPVSEPGLYRIEVRVGEQTQTFEQAVTIIPEGGCCGGYFLDVVLTFERPSQPADTCATLDVDTCATTDGCSVVSGWETTLDAADGLCVDYSAGQVGFACQSAELACPAVISYAQPPEGGTCVVFGGCVPAGWTACDGAPVVNECSTP